MLTYVTSNPPPPSDLVGKASHVFPNIKTGGPVREGIAYCVHADYAYMTPVLTLPKERIRVRRGFISEVGLGDGEDTVHQVSAAGKGTAVEKWLGRAGMFVEWSICQVPEFACCRDW